VKPDTSPPSPSVLLVTADSLTRQRLQWTLDGEIALCAVDTAAEAFEVAQRARPLVAVVDTDVAGGVPLVARLRTSNPSLRGVFLVGERTSDDEARQLLALGVVLSMPVDPGRLEQAVRNAIRLHGMSANVERLKRTTGQFALVRPDAAGATSASHAAGLSLRTRQEACAPTLGHGRKEAP